MFRQRQRRNPLSVLMVAVWLAALLPAWPRTVFAAEVGIRSPTPGAVLAGTVALTATASPEIREVDFWIDGMYQGSAGAPAYTLRWDSTALANGEHTLTGRAWTEGLELLTSAPVGFAVRNAPPAVGAGPEAAPAPAVTFVAPAAGAQLRGAVRIQARAPGMREVDVFVSGHYLGTAAAPDFTLEFDTQEYANGTHVLELRGTDAAGAFAVGDTRPVSIANPAPLISLNVSGGQQVSGRFRLQAGAREVAEVDFFAGERYIGSSRAPFALDWDTAQFTNGPLAVTARGWTAGGQLVRSHPITVAVSNPIPRGEVALLAPAAGTVLSGHAVLLQARGQGIREFDFFADDAYAGTAAGPGAELRWDSTAVANGPHRLSVRGRTFDDQWVYGPSVSVRVENQTRLALTAPAAGAVLTGEQAVLKAGVAGFAAVDFLLDGMPVGAVTSAPYEFTLDLPLADGRHTLGLRGHRPDGTTAYAPEVTVTTSAFGAAGDPDEFRLLEPAPGEPVSGLLTLRAAAPEYTDYVEYTVAGNQVRGRGPAPFAATLDTTEMEDGHYFVSAVAVKQNGKTHPIPGVVIKVRNPPLGRGGIPMNLMLAEPRAGVVKGTQVRLVAQAAGVDQVTFYLDDRPIQWSHGNGQFEAVWDSTTVANGEHTLTVGATDHKGHPVRSQPVQVKTENPVSALQPPAARETVTSLAIGKVKVEGTAIRKVAPGQWLTAGPVRLNGVLQTVAPLTLYESPPAVVAAGSAPFTLPVPPDGKPASFANVNPFRLDAGAAEPRLDLRPTSLGLLEMAKFPLRLTELDISRYNHAVLHGELKLVFLDLIANLGTGPNGESQGGGFSLKGHEPKGTETEVTYQGWQLPLKALTINYDPVRGSFTFAAATNPSILKLPRVNAALATELEWREGRLAHFLVQVSNADPGLPIGATGMRLTGGKLEATGFSTDVPELMSVGAQLDAIELMKGWVTGTVDLKNTGFSLSAEEVTFVIGGLKGGANIAFVAAPEFKLSAKADLDLALKPPPLGAIAGMHLKGHLDFLLEGEPLALAGNLSGRLKVNLPIGCDPEVGVYLKGTGSASDRYYAFTGTAEAGCGRNVQLRLQVDNRAPYIHLAGPTLQVARPAGPVLIAASLPFAPGADRIPFTVPPYKKSMSAEVIWAGDGVTDLYLIDPNGRTYLMDDPEAAYELVLAGKYTGMSIADPIPGEWTIVITNPLGIGDYQVNADYIAYTPIARSLTVSGTNPVEIAWAFDRVEPDTTVEIRLGTDSDRIGSLIAKDLPAVGTYLFNPERFPTGDYYVWVEALNSDWQFTRVSQYLYILDPLGLAPPTGLAARATADGAVLTWRDSPARDLRGYTVYWRKVGDTPWGRRGLWDRTEFALTGLAPGTYEVAVSADNLDAHEGPRSAPVRFTVGSGSSSTAPDPGDGSASGTDPGGGTAGGTAPAPAPRDMAGHWARAQVQELIQRNVVSGYPDGTYRPETPVRRSEFIKLVTSALGEVAPTDQADLFAEVPESHWVQPYLAAATEQGIVAPMDYPDGIDVDGYIPRAEMAVMVARALGLDPDDGTQEFTDADLIRADDQGYILAAVRAGILSGFPDGHFGPNEQATRAQAAVMIHRLLRQLGQ